MLVAISFVPATTIGAGPCLTNLMISQVYGGGGNAGASYENDFVELHNPGITTISLTGYAIQYATATGNTWTVTALNGNIGPGGYFLIQAAAGLTAGLPPLPTADATSATNLAATGGKVALTALTTPLTGNCPASGAIVDFVGYGTADCGEGGSAAPAPSNTTSVKRTIDGCGDTNANGADFVAVTPVPRNSGSAPHPCECSLNGTGLPAEMDFCNVQFPAVFSVQSGVSTPSIFAQVYESGYTEAAGPNLAITAQIGYGAQGVNPTTQPGFTWTAASYNIQVGNNDEYAASFIAPAPGTYNYASRFSLDGVNWTYCDVDGAGSNAGLSFSTAQMGTMTVDGGGAPCTYAVSPTDLSNRSSGGGSAIVTVTTPAGCAVNVTSYQPWVSLNSVTPNGGTTTVSLGVAANAGPARATSIKLADRLYLVTQQAGP